MPSDLFGGSDSRAEPARDITPQAFRGLRGPLAGVLSRLFGGAGGDALSGIPEGPGSEQVPVSEEEQALLGLLSAEGGTTQARQGLLNRTLEGEYVNPESNPFLQAFTSAQQRTTLRNLTDTLESSLPGRFTSGGQFVQPRGSSAFDRAAALATGRAAESISDIATNIGFGAYEAERGRQQEALQIGQQEVDTLVKQLQAEALPRLIEQRGLDVGIEQFNRRIENLLKVLQIAAGVSAPTVASGGGESRSRSGIFESIPLVT